MGLSSRIFIIDNDDNLYRVSVKKFTKLFTNPKTSEGFIEFANQRFRYALVMIEFENRIPIEIFNIEWSIINFDEEGKLDLEAWNESLQLSFNAKSPNIKKSPKYIGNRR